MSSTSQVTDFVDLYTDLQNRARVQTGVTATENQAKRYINIALQDMHLGLLEQMPWAERSADLTTQQDYTTGTLTITQGSTSLAGASTAWNTNNVFSVANMRVGGKIVINGGVEVYEISAVASDTAATLTAAFVRADVSAASYVYFEDEYALHADFLRPLSFKNFDIASEIELISRKQFRFHYPRNKTTGKPRVATIIDRDFSGNTTPVRKVLFHQPPDDFYRITYPFITNKLAVSSAGVAQTSLTADADEPIVPLQFRHAIVWHALFHWYRDKKDDGRSTAARAEYSSIMGRIASDQEIGHNGPRITPRVSGYVGRARRPYRGRGQSRFVVGDAWDQLRQ